jgi:serine/threonine protein kinase
MKKAIPVRSTPRQETRDLPKSIPVARVSAQSSGRAEWLQGKPAVSCLRDLDERIDANASTVIASGSFGDVRLATDNDTKRRVAIKVLVEQDARKEVQILSELDHPNIVKLLDVMIHRRQLPETTRPGPYLCIIMDYIPNSYTIAKLIMKMGAVDRNLISYIMKQLASALMAMHAQGVVHRDLWAENVLLNQGTGSVMLVDFGNAEYFNSGPDSAKCLNLPYMSPEASKKQRQGPGDDCWALGLMLSELLTGKFIQDRLQCHNKPIHGDAAKLTELLSDASAHDDTSDARLGKSCKQLLNLNAKQRMTMATFQSVLVGNIQNAGNTRVEKPSAIEIPVESVSQHKAPAASCTASSESWVATATVSTTGSLSQWQATTPSVQQHFTRVLNADGTPANGMARSGSTAVISAEAVGSTWSTSGSLVSMTAAASRTTFAAGQRVKYVSRSNGQSYPGLVVERCSNLSDNAFVLKVLLDCGEKKEITETSLWRLSHE